MIIVPQIAIDLIKQREKYCSCAYKLPGEKCWTIGYGTYGTFPSDNRPVCKGQTISEEDAEFELVCYCRKNCGDCVEEIARAFKSRGQAMTDKQKAALYSLIYNCGAPRWKTSKCRSFLLCGNLDKAMSEWDFWANVDPKLKNGIKKRRNEEIELFFGVKNYWKI